MRFQIEGNIDSVTSIKDLTNALLRAQRAGDQALTPGQSIKVKGLRIRTYDRDINDVRRWALAQGHPVGKRGRIAQELQDAYDAAH